MPLHCIDIIAHFVHLLNTHDHHTEKIQMKRSFDLFSNSICGNQFWFDCISTVVKISDCHFDQSICLACEKCAIASASDMNMNMNVQL